MSVVLRHGSFADIAGNGWLHNALRYH